MIKRLMTKYILGMLTCQEIDSFLYDFHQGNLSFAQQLQFKLHIAMCSECQVYLDDYRNTIRLAKESFVIENELVTTSIDKVPEDLINAILSVRKSVDSTKIVNDE